MHATHIDTHTHMPKHKHKLRELSIDCVCLCAVSVSGKSFFPSSGTGFFYNMPVDAGVPKRYAINTY